LTPTLCVPIHRAGGRAPRRCEGRHVRRLATSPSMARRNSASGPAGLQYSAPRLRRSEFSGPEGVDLAVDAGLDLHPSKAAGRSARTGCPLAGAWCCPRRYRAPQKPLLEDRLEAVGTGRVVETRLAKSRCAFCRRRVVDVLLHLILLVGVSSCDAADGISGREPALGRQCHDPESHTRAPKASAQSLAGSSASRGRTSLTRDSVAGYATKHVHFGP